MNDVKCNKEAEISEMLTLIKTLTKQVYGNGQKGIAFMIPELVTQISELSKDMQLLTTNVSGLMKFMSEYEGAEKNKLSARHKTQIALYAILGTAGIIITVILKFL